MSDVITTSELIALLQRLDPTGLLPVALDDWQESWSCPSFQAAKLAVVSDMSRWNWKGDREKGVSGQFVCLGIDS